MHQPLFQFETFILVQIELVMAAHQLSCLVLTLCILSALADNGNKLLPLHHC